MYNITYDVIKCVRIVMKYKNNETKSTKSIIEK